MCVFPFIFVIDAALLFLYSIMFFVYAHSLGCHRTHFPAPHSFFYICFSLPIHIWFLSVDCCIMVPPIVLSCNFHRCWSIRVVVGPYAEPTLSSVQLPSSCSFCPAWQIIKLNELPFGGELSYDIVSYLLGILVSAGCTPSIPPPSAHFGAFWREKNHQNLCSRQHTRKPLP